MDDAGGALLRALRAAAGSFGVEDALLAVLREALLASRAGGGCILVEGSATPRVADGLDPARLDGVETALARREEWVDAPLALPGEGGTLLLAPMQLRAVPVGVLVLELPGGAPDPGRVEVARAFADLAALTLEHDRLHEDSRAARQERDHFLTSLNHEVRTPAMSLTLNAHLLRAGVGGALPEKAERALRKVEADVATIVQLLDGLAALGEVQADEAVHHDLVQPREVVLALLRQVEPAADRKKLRLSLHAARTLPPLQTDRRQLSRVLLHLLSNAIKYTAEGGIDVRLEHSVHTVGSQKRVPSLWIRVRDTGPGVPPEELERILHPFAQVHEGARTESPLRGAGLGLSVARKLARALGGDLLLESTPGQGTTASLVLPCRH